MNVGTIAVLIGILSLIVPVLVAGRTRPMKRLDYRSVSDRELAPGAYVGPDSLEVRSGENKPAHPRIITVRLSCSGTEALRADDFRGPIRLTASAGILLLAAGATGFPGGADVDVHVLGNEVVIRPLSLDRGESLELEVHVDGSSDPALIPIAHTVGVVKRTGRPSRWRIAWRPWTDELR